MKFKLNACEKFIYRHGLAIALFSICLVIAYVVLNSIYIDRINVFLPLSIAFIIYTIPYVVCANSLKKKIDKFNAVANNQLDMNTFLEGIDYLINITPKRSKLNLASNLIGKINMLWNIGDYEKMEQELNYFSHNFDLKKIDVSIDFVMHARFAILALAKNDIERYKEEVIIMQTLMSLYDDSKIFRDKLRYTYNDVMLTAGAMLSDENSDEQRFVNDCFAALNFSPINGKPRKDAVMKIEYLDLHHKLFIFFKNRNDLEKTRYHALQLMEIGNMQLKAYRDAKEFLDNENRSN